jgi:microcystin-dependent protein
MKTKLILLPLFLLAALLALTLSAHAAIPHLMNFQGKATDRLGAPLNGSYNLTFRIYNSATGGSPKWSETQPNISISNGIFQVQLGSVAPLNLFFDESYWISIEINTDGEMSPRTRLASVGYAFTAETSNNNIPTGVVMAWTTNTPPDGWLLCDGRTVSRTTYARLFNVVGSTYGAGDGSTTFSLPDMQGRVLVGKSSETEFRALGQEGGKKTLTIADMPAHTHTIANSEDQGGGLYTLAGETASGIVTTSSEGSGDVGGNLQPYVTLNYIIKT